MEDSFLIVPCKKVCIDNSGVALKSEWTPGRKENIRPMFISTDDNKLWSPEVIGVSGFLQAR